MDAAAEGEQETASQRERERERARRERNRETESERGKSEGLDCVSAEGLDCVSAAVLQGGEDHRSLIIIHHFLQKSPMIGGSFAERDLQLKASFLCSPPCTQDVKSELYAHRTPARQSIQKQKKMVEISLGHG